MLKIFIKIKVNNNWGLIKRSFWKIRFYNLKVTLEKRVRN